MSYPLSCIRSRQKKKNLEVLVTWSVVELGYSRDYASTALHETTINRRPRPGSPQKGALLQDADSRRPEVVRMQHSRPCLKRGRRAVLCAHRPGTSDQDIVGSSDEHTRMPTQVIERFPIPLPSFPHTIRSSTLLHLERFCCAYAKHYSFTKVTHS
ncbi:hypothetical protein OH76DRAFT_971624 [Lentinus brumalis]|uniref:Uncharacterized protein n=1 Tax=Lentinus brumalis TaxID=2498619 RepID=A0A371DPN2_9APHY|nr:hypothetical protein OH76DRAFT_971624 [Polyporus brumalis]